MYAYYSHILVPERYWSRNKATMFYELYVRQWEIIWTTLYVSLRLTLDKGYLHKQSLPSATSKVYTMGFYSLSHFQPSQKYKFVVPWGVFLHTVEYTVSIWFGAIYSMIMNVCHVLLENFLNFPTFFIITTTAYLFVLYYTNNWIVHLPEWARYFAKYCCSEIEENYMTITRGMMKLCYF